VGGLIFAAVSGASPAELVDFPTPKVQLHFDVVGLHNVSAPSAGMSREEVGAFLDDRYARGREVNEAVVRARGDISISRDRLTMLASSRKFLRR
jgi:hypothetical protein